MISKASKEIWISALNLQSAIQRIDPPRLLSGCEFDFNEALVTFHVSGIQSDCAIGVINRLVRSLQISRVYESELLIRLGVFWVCLYCVLQHGHTLWEIILLYQQNRHAHGQP